MSTLVSDIITQSFVDLAVIQPGETISSDMQANAFLVLNQMWSQWSAERTMAYLVVHQTFTITAGTSKYTLGTAGTLVASARPVQVTGWSQGSGNFSTGGDVLGFDEFRSKTLNATGRRSVLAELMAADDGFPNITIELFPTPDTAPGSLTLDFTTPLVAFPATSTSLTLPDGYEAALHFNLAVALAPQYARANGITQELAANAQNTKASIVQKNAEIIGIAPTPPRLPANQ